MIVLTVLAILLAPLIALRVSQWLEDKKDAKKRKLDVFRTLMSTRAEGLSRIHVEALNRIELEFYGKDKKSKAVVDAWGIYHDHLHDRAFETKPLEGEALDRWVSKKHDLLTELLYEMAICLGYRFDKVQIKRGHYYPIGHSELEIEQRMMRRALLDLLVGKTALPMDVIAFPSTASQEELKEQKQIRERLINYFDGKISLPVQIIKGKKNQPE